MVMKILRILFIILSSSITSCRDSVLPIDACKLCYGTGYIHCTVCKGTGVCNYCTIGKIDCILCGGRGHYWDYNNESYITCSYCKGTGDMQCPWCSGLYNCVKCHGIDSREKCPDCNGTGKDLN